MPFDRGNVVLAIFPDSNLRTTKRRPVVIVQSTGLSTGLPQLIVAMVTSNMQRAGHPSRVAVLKETPSGRQSGLIFDSVIMTDNLATLAESELDRTLGKFDDMTAIDAALRHTLGL